MCVCVGARARVCVYIYTHAGTQARSVILVSISPAVFLRQSSVYCGGTTESSQIYRDSLEFHSRERPRINLSSALPYNPNNGSVIKFQRERERDGRKTVVSVLRRRTRLGRACPHFLALFHRESRGRCFEKGGVNPVGLSSVLAIPSNSISSF